MLRIMPLSRYARVRDQADTVDCPRPNVEVIKYVVPGAHAATLTVAEAPLRMLFNCL
jgi:hypothetical protein